MDNFLHDTAAEKHERLILQQKCKTKNDTCAVCLETLFMKSVIYLPCKHFFHSTCLNKVIDTKIYTCPLCRCNFENSLSKLNFQFPETSLIDTHLIYLIAIQIPDMYLSW